MSMFTVENEKGNHNRSKDSRDKDEIEVSKEPKKLLKYIWPTSRIMPEQKVLSL